MNAYRSLGAQRASPRDYQEKAGKLQARKDSTAFIASGYAPPIEKRTLNADLDLHIENSGGIVLLKKNNIKKSMRDRRNTDGQEEAEKFDKKCDNSSDATHIIHANQSGLSIITDKLPVISPKHNSQIISMENSGNIGIIDGEIGDLSPMPFLSKA